MYKMCMFLQKQFKYIPGKQSLFSPFTHTRGRSVRHGKWKMNTVRPWIREDEGHYTNQVCQAQATEHPEYQTLV